MNELIREQTYASVSGSKVKWNIYDIIVVGICIFSVATLLYNIINPIIPLNRIIGLVLLLAMVSTYRKTTSKVLIVAISLTVLFVLSIFNATVISDGINNAIYWYSTMITLWFFADKRRTQALGFSFRKNIKFVRFVVAIDFIVVTAGFFVNSCYSQLWGNRYYVGFAYGAHILACGCCLAMTLALFVVQDINNYLIKIGFFIPFLLGVLECGARTYLVSILVILFVLYKYQIKNINVKVILIPISILAGVYLFMHSGLLEKFLDPNKYANKTGMDLFTSGRSTFWLIDLKAYLEGNIYRLFFGNGFDFSYLTNLQRYGRSNWAHNDFIEVLISAGIIGLGLYFYILLNNYKVYRYKLNRLTCWAVAIYYLFVAFVNGLIIYQHYLYSYIVLSAFVVYVEQSGVRMIKGK